MQHEKNLPSKSNQSKLASSSIIELEKLLESALREENKTLIIQIIHTLTTREKKSFKSKNLFKDHQALVPWIKIITCLLKSLDNLSEIDNKLYEQIAATHHSPATMWEKKISNKKKRAITPILMSSKINTIKHMKGKDLQELIADKMSELENKKTSLVRKKEIIESLIPRNNKIELIIHYACKLQATIYLIDSHLNNFDKIVENLENEKKPLATDLIDCLKIIEKYECYGDHETTIEVLHQILFLIFLFSLQPSDKAIDGEEKLDILLKLIESIYQRKRDKEQEILPIIFSSLNKYFDKVNLNDKKTNFLLRWATKQSIIFCTQSDIQQGFADSISNFIQKIINFHFGKGNELETMYYYCQKYELCKKFSSPSLLEPNWNALKFLLKRAETKNIEAFINLFEVPWEEFIEKKSIFELSKLSENLVFIYQKNNDQNYLNIKLSQLIQLIRDTNTKTLNKNEKDTIYKQVLEVTNFLRNDKEWEKHAEIILDLLDIFASFNLSSNLTIAHINKDLAASCLEKNDIEGAIDFYEAAIEYLKTNKNPTLLEEISHNCLTQKLKLADSALSKNDPALALYYYNSVLSNFGSKNKSRENYESILLKKINTREKLAEKYWQQQKTDKTIYQYELALKETKKLSETNKNKIELIATFEKKLNELHYSTLSSINLSEKENLSKNIELAPHPTLCSPSSFFKSKEKGKEKITDDFESSLKDAEEKEDQQKLPSFFTAGMKLGNYLTASYLKDKNNIRTIFDKSSPSIQKLKKQDPEKYKRFKGYILAGETCKGAFGTNGLKFLRENVWECKLPGLSRVTGATRKDPETNINYIVFDTYHKGRSH